MRVAHVVGIDPGLVHTGCVKLQFYPAAKEIFVSHLVVNGIDTVPVTHWLQSGANKFDVFIEGYRPRSHFNSDQRMVTAVAELKKRLPGSQVINNTGVKQVVSMTLMQLLGVWQWPQATHHQDLRSAARIALYGMMKDPVLNRVLASTVRDHLAGNTWQIERL